MLSNPRGLPCVPSHGQTIKSGYACLYNSVVAVILLGGFAHVFLVAWPEEQVLAGIFGKKAASTIVSGASKAKRRGEGGGDSAAARAKALAASRKVEVTEIKKYAGKDIV